MPSASLAPIGVLQALATLPWDEMVDLIEAAQEGGLDEDEAIQAAVELLDTMVDLSMLGPAGAALELVDAAILGAKDSKTGLAFVMIDELGAAKPVDESTRSPLVASLALTGRCQSSFPLSASKQ